MTLFKKFLCFVITAVLLIPVLPAQSAFAENKSGDTTVVFEKEEPAAYLENAVKWNGKSELEKNTNYYIDKKVGIRKTVIIPKSSSLTIKSGGQLQVLKAGSLSVYGKVFIQSKAKLYVTGKLVSRADSYIDNSGSISASVSAALSISGAVLNASGGEFLSSAKTNLYRSAFFMNEGTISLYYSSNTLVTGEILSRKDAKFSVNGYMAITLNGKLTAEGVFSVTAVGEFWNSGVIVFEKTSTITKAGKFLTTKSGSVIDYHPKADQTDPDAMSGYKGIDVSRYQGDIDWALVKASGIDFAILRASRGKFYSKSEKKTYKTSKDDKFDEYAAGALEAGIEIGAYHYLYATTVADAVKEAQFFLETVKPYKMTYPLVLDVEEVDQKALGSAKLSKIVDAFMAEVEAAGYYAMLYSSKNWLSSGVYESYINDKYAIWLAQWHTAPTYKGDFAIWQYSCTGSVPGITGDVDMNISYKNYPEIMRTYSLNNLHWFE